MKTRPGEGESRDVGRDDLRPIDAGDATAPPTRLPNRIIRASAGTGKTFQLSNRYLELILSGHLPERVLATTFTRKAAGEILERILYRLARASQGPDQAAQLAGELQLPEVSAHGLGGEDCRRALERLTRNLHRLRVSTLDSFFLQATQTLTLELGLPPSWQIVDELEEISIREAALAGLLERDQVGDVLRLVNWLARGETQRGVYRLLTDTIRTMYHLFVESPADAWQRIPKVSGLDAAQRESLFEQLSAWTAEGANDARLQSAVQKILLLAREEDWTELAQQGVVQKILADDTTYYRKPMPSDLVTLLQQLVEHVRAEIQNQFAIQTQASYQLLERFHAQHETLKLQRRALRFDDLTRRLGQLGEAAQLKQLAFRLDASIDSLLLDEFQDTSLEQWRVMRPFAQHVAVRDPHRSFLCVGDTKQAIYGWRGGNAELLQAVAEEIPDVADQQLDCSFRSSPVVIEAVNRINEGMARHDHLGRAELAVRQWCEAFPVHRTSRQELPGYVSLESHAAGTSTDDERTQAIKLAVDRVQELRGRVPQRSIAVLVRTNELVGRVIYELRSRGIAASEEGGNPLTDSAAVQLVVSLLQLADFPQDSAARYHLATSPWASTLRFENDRDEALAVGLSQRVRNQLADEGYGETIATWADQLRPFTNDREERRLGQLTQLALRYQRALESPRGIGHHHQQRQPLSAAGFLEVIHQERVSDPTEDPVRVMTVHQSKGLQFDVVLLPDLNRRLIGQTPNCVFDRPRATDPIGRIVRYVPEGLRTLLPAWIQTVHENHELLSVREELSVLYVALTRAVHSLQMIVAPSEYAASGDVEDKPRRKQNPERLEATLAGLIRAALADGVTVPPETLVAQFGDPDWWTHLPPAREPLGTTPAIPARPSIRFAARSDRGRARRAGRESLTVGGWRASAYSPARRTTESSGDVSWHADPRLL